MEDQEPINKIVSEVEGEVKVTMPWEIEGEKDGLDLEGSTLKGVLVVESELKKLYTHNCGNPDRHAKDFFDLMMDIRRLIQPIRKVDQKLFESFYR